MENKKYNFSSMIVPIDDEVKGLVRLEILPRMGKILELSGEIHRLSFNLNDTGLVKTLMKSIIDRCDVCPFNNDEIFNSISSKILKKKTFNYYQLEDLSSKLKFIDSYMDQSEKIKFPPEIFEVGFKLLVRDIKRIQRYVDSFLFNYSTIMDTLRYVDGKIEEEKEKITNSTDYLFNNSTIALTTNNIVEKSVPTAENQEEEIVRNKERTNIDIILEYLLISPQLLSYLIHLIFNYYRYFHFSNIEKNEREVLINFESIFPHDFTINKMYIYGLIESIENSSLDKINMLTKSLSNYLLANTGELKPIELECIIYILFFYSLRHLMETQKKWIYSNLTKLFTDNELQCKLINKFIPKISGIPFKFVMEKRKQSLTENEILIETISSKYSYMKELDQNKFADIVFEEIKKKSNSTEINHKTDSAPVIGIKNLINVQKLLKNNIVESEMVSLPKNINNKFSVLLDYKEHKNPKVLTDTFDLFLRYLENPIVVVTEKNYKIPNNILNLFEKMKSCLNDVNFKKEDISTLQYYHRLVNIVPNDLQFSSILFIIFQLIIPYMYYFFDITTFEDVFLTTYKFE